MFFLFIHGSFPDAPTHHQRHMNYCIHYGEGDSPVEYSDCVRLAIQIAKNGGTEQFGDLQKLERVIFYSSKSKPYEVNGKTFMWLAGMGPNPADPSYMGFGDTGEYH